MQIAVKLANYSLGEADILRRAMSKKKKEILISEEEKFITRSIENGYSREVAKKVYDLITEKGYKIGNIDSNIIAQAPKLRPYIEQIRNNL